MLNYIWAGLIILSLVFALVSDTRDFATDPYRNDQPIALSVEVPGGYDAEARRQSVVVRVQPDALAEHYGLDSAEGFAPSYDGVLVTTRDGRQLRFAQDADLPEPLGTIRTAISPRDNDLRGSVDFEATPGDTLVAAAVTFGKVRFVKMSAITVAAIDFAEVAVTIALGLIGTLALWMGLLKIAETSGLVNVFVRIVQPVLRPLFPDIPKNHPALGLVSLNLTANMLGLGNAATPLGIKAMESMQTINPEKDTATNPMVMLLAMNTASVQIVPPALLVALMGLQVNQLFFSILITTSISLFVAVSAAKIAERFPSIRASDPMRRAAEEPAAVPPPPAA